MTDLRVPDVEDAGVGGADHLHVAAHVLAVQHNVLAAPADDLFVEPSDAQEVRPETK